jgi:hypothetical protein
MRWQRTGTGHGGKEKAAREETVRIWLVRQVQDEDKILEGMQAIRKGT